MTSREQVFRLYDPDRPQHIVIDDDGRVAYAYLLRHNEIVSDVWLYNVSRTPSVVDWSNRDDLPFLNPAPFCDNSQSISRLSVRSPLRCDWYENGVLLFLDDLLIAKLEEGSKPGWSRSAIDDGPLAKTATPPRARLEAGPRVTTIGLLGQLQIQLSALEMQIAESLFEVEPLLFDESRSSLVRKAGFLRCQFCSRDDRCCPFDLDFGRDENENHLNFFVGFGAELANFEEFSGPSEAVALAGDLRNFLSSSVECRLFRSPTGRVAKAHYCASRLLVSGEPIRIEFDNSRFFERLHETVVSYRSWLGSASPDGV